MATSADLTVVIPTLGRPILRRALDALAANTRTPVEVILVDQGRSAEVQAMASEFAARGLRVRWIPSSERGRARGVNRGVEAATTRFVAVTDDDCLAHPTWIEALAARLAESPDDIVTGRVEAGDATVVSTVTADVAIVQRQPSVRFDRLSGGNMALARTTFERIGGLDEDPCVRTAEDAEYAYRALRSGVAIRYAPEAAVTHLGWRDDSARTDQYADYARSHGGFYGKYLRRGDAFIAARAAVHWMRAIRRWAVGMLSGDRERARFARAYVLGLPGGIRAGWRSAAPRRR
ncbi:MAG TPA: glycosyltransferase family A protein [Gemmatimonadaceae bacterium]|nr:glycosyltransferase family A protein [Gemmatimonadaceae bacterium]